MKKLQNDLKEEKSVNIFAKIRSKAQEIYKDNSKKWSEEKNEISIILGKKSFWI